MVCGFSSAQSQTILLFLLTSYGLDLKLAVDNVVKHTERERNIRGCFHWPRGRFEGNYYPHSGGSIESSCGNKVKSKESETIVLGNNQERPYPRDLFVTSSGLRCELHSRGGIFKSEKPRN